MTKKITVVKQQDLKDCGPCSLQSIILYYGGYVSLEKIREDTLTNLNGTTFYHLIKAAKSYGFDAIGKKCNFDELANIIMPAIVHVRYKSGFTHFMVLVKIANEKVYVMDPAKGKDILDVKSFKEIFTGGVLEIFPRNNIVCFEKKNSLYDLFLKLIFSNKKIVFSALVSNLCLVIVTILTSLYFKIGYEMSIKNSFGSLFKYVLYLFLVLTLIKVLITYLKNYYENYLDKNIDTKLIEEFISHIFNLPLKVTSMRSTGEIITRVGELLNIKEFFAQLFIFCTLDLVMALSVSIILINLHSGLALVFIGVLVLYIVISFFVSPYIYKRINGNIEFQTIFNEKLIENVDMLSSIKNLNKNKYALRKIEISACNLIEDNYDLAQKVNAIDTIKNLLLEISIYAVNTYGLITMFNGKLSLASLVTFNTLMYYLLDPVKNVVSLIPKFNFLRASYHKLCDFIDIDEEKMGKSEKIKDGTIIFENVSFSYDKFHYVIENFNLNIKDKEKVMIQGESGSGKSTICHLISRQNDLDSGTIKVAGKNILDYSLNTIRDNIVYVGQKEKICTDTIKNNIAYGNNLKNFDKVCQICEIEAVVKNKPFRYDFGIDASISNISGGEKQRIILARALMKDFEILVLDEALSELDYDLERKIIKNLLIHYCDKTIIYVSHKKQDDLFERVIDIKGGYNG